MVVNKKVTGRASNIPCGLAVGAGISMGITFMLSLATAILVSKEYIQEAWIGYLSMVILIVSSAVGAWTAGEKIKKKKMQMAILSAAVYYMLLLTLTALFFGGQYEGMGITMMMVLIGGGAGGILSASQSSGIRKKHRYTKSPR